MTETCEAREVAVTAHRTWRDFTLEDHMRSFVGIPEGCIIRMRPIRGKNVYRVNVIRLSKNFSNEPGNIVKSAVVKVITSPDGYTFVEETL